MALSDIEMNEMGADCRDSGFCVSRYHAILLNTSKHYGDLVKEHSGAKLGGPAVVLTRFTKSKS